MWMKTNFLLCDECTIIADDADPSRREVWYASKACGWEKVGDRHLCPDCVAKEKDK